MDSVVNYNPSQRDSLVERLMNLGLTLYEAKSYLALVKYGELTSTNLVKLTGIPQSRIYDVVSSLQRKGLIWVQSGRPMKFRVVEPSIAIKRLTEEITKDSEELIDELSKYFLERKVIAGPSLWIVKGKKSIENWINKSIGESKKEILFAAPLYLFETMYQTLLDAYERRNVSLTLVIYYKGGHEELQHKLTKIANVRIREIVGPYILISDNNRCIIGSSLFLNSEDCYADVIEMEDELLYTLAYFFNQSLFTTAKPIESLFVPTKKMTFLNIWSAIEIIRNIFSVGRTPYAKVLGKSIKTNESVQVEGKVVSTNVIPGLIYSFTLEDSSGKQLTVGGMRATLEDIEAKEIYIWA
ncbi:MAG: TrmB family transcriptional regulator sugar-binding domain-containing protein [Thermoproteota archaeon]|nr:TrmB family transcriptional regulator [Candidatus Brockarchaeota archaeon]